MADETLPSRFVSQSEIEQTNQRKEDAWKAAYARIGQEPPKLEREEAYDGRTLAEKLAANKAAKQEEYENSHKLSAQFRSLDPDEIGFLDEVALKRMEEEKKVKDGDLEELKGWRAAVQARDLQISPPIASTSTSTKPPSPTVSKNPAASKPPTTTTTTKPAVKLAKGGLKGVVVTKKRARPEVKVGEGAKVGKPVGVGATGLEKVGDVQKDLGGKGKEDGEKEEGDRKRRRVE